MSGFCLLNFMDAYSGYNQIQMNPTDAPKTEFMTDRNNYYYNIMPFGLRIVGDAYQRLIDMVFPSQIGRNLEVYVDDLLVKRQEKVKHVDDLRRTFESIRKFVMKIPMIHADTSGNRGKLGKIPGDHLYENPDFCERGSVTDMEGRCLIPISIL